VIRRSRKASPPTSTTASISGLPSTHHVAGWPTMKAAATAPTATGLKMCRRRTVNRNFDAIAAAEATISPSTP
jgi:hypothetical protein